MCVCVCVYIYTCDTHHSDTVALSVDGILYSASSTNFLGTEFDVARVTGPEKEQLRIHPAWLSGMTTANTFLPVIKSNRNL